MNAQYSDCCSFRGILAILLTRLNNPQIFGTFLPRQLILIEMKTRQRVITVVLVLWLLAALTFFYNSEVSYDDSMELLAGFFVRVLLRPHHAMCMCMCQFSVA